nr:hypothetical protein [uncultured Flavobacterium sp.]
MNLGILNETVILIDTDFLNERISHNLTLYKELYPDKNFEKINLADLLYKFALNARVEEVGNNVDIIFTYTLSNDILTYCVPDNLTFDITNDGVQVETDKGTFLIRSFFGDINETCTEHFLNVFQRLYINTSISRIIIVADNSELNSELEMLYEEQAKSIFFLKKSHNTHIHIPNTSPIKYVNINYAIAYALGLNANEI